MEEAPTTTTADPPPYDPERQARLTAEAMLAMRELVARIPRQFDVAAEPEAAMRALGARIPRQFDVAAEPEAIFVPRGATAVAGARRGGRR